MERGVPTQLETSRMHFSNLSPKLTAMILDMSVPYAVIVLGVFAKAPNPRKACNNLSAEEDAPADKGS